LELVTLSLPCEDKSFEVYPSFISRLRESLLSLRTVPSPVCSVNIPFTRNLSFLSRGESLFTMCIIERVSHRVPQPEQIGLKVDLHLFKSLIASFVSRLGEAGSRTTNDARHYNLLISYSNEFKPSPQFQT